MNYRIRKLVWAGVFLALGIVVPSIFHLTFGAIAGKIFLPMPFVVLLASLVLGPFYGLILGCITPLISSSITGMPAFAILPFMTFELASYGFLAGFFQNKLRINTLISLTLSMVLGRVLLGLFVSLVGHQLGLTVGAVSYVLTAFTTGFPGILLQVILIPLIVNRLKAANYLKFNQ
ncbi:MAG: ECF transporter S component [Caldisericaceae bacterium]